MPQVQATEQAPPMHMMEKAVSVTYTNWRGETAQRTIIPMEVYWGKTDWHPKEQWLLKVWDVDRGAYREYALQDIKKWQ
jgi:predicted DNA-binding transcriptional regulator YafY